LALEDRDDKNLLAAFGEQSELSSGESVSFGPMTLSDSVLLSHDDRDSDRFGDPSEYGCGSVPLYSMLLSDSVLCIKDVRFISGDHPASLARIASALVSALTPVTKPGIAKPGVGNAMLVAPVTKQALETAARLPCIVVLST